MKSAAYEWLQQNHPTYSSIMARFALKDKDLSSYLFMDAMLQLPAQKWWRLLATDYKNTKDSAIYEASVFFAKLHCLPASSAGLERLFSTYGIIWTKLRNRLDPDTATKLVQANKYLNSEKK
jgi:hypothetical protein